MGKRSRLGAAVLTTVVLASGCAGADSTPDVRKADTGRKGPLLVNILGAPTTLDPAVACGVNDMHLMDNLYSRLVDYGVKPGPAPGTTIFDPGAYRPDLATSWEIGDDGKTYTFKLAGGAKFASGAPIDAKAVKYSLDRTLTMGMCGKSYLNDGYDKPALIKKVEVVDPATVSVELRWPDPNFLQALAQPAASIVDPTVIEAHGGIAKGKANTHFANNPAGASGPFVLKSYEPGRSATLAANPAYHGKRPASENVQVNFITDTSTLLLQARNGKADVTVGLSKKAARSLEGNPCCKVAAFPSALSLDIALNWRYAPFANEKLRRALTHAFPYQEMLASVGQGYGEPFYGPMPPDMVGYNAEGSRQRQYDPDLARKLIAESGVPTPVTFELSIPAGQEELSEFATAVQSVLSKVDVKVTVREIPPSERAKILNSGAYEAIVISGGPGIVDPGYLLSYDMSCDSPYNITKICVPEADTNWAAARQTMDADKRQEHWDKVTAAWVEASPKLKFWSVPAMVAMDGSMSSLHYSVHPNFSTWK
ncbi:ABC transporter substrate-binding protein [Sinosporangium siamense]|nr:ABC transporter substrate-binding protein [Sinosporangium siamense]